MMLFLSILTLSLLPRGIFSSCVCSTYREVSSFSRKLSHSHESPYHLAYHDVDEHNHVLQSKSKRKNRFIKNRKENLEFVEPLESRKGEKYQRPSRATPVHHKYPSPKKDDVSDDSCISEQVHVLLGDRLDSVVIQFATTNLFESSIVYYSDNQEDMLSGSKNVQYAEGISRSYSQLLYIVGYLTDPAMGYPVATDEEVIDLLDTTSFAYDKTTGEHYTNWYNVTKVQTGSAQYNNPQVYYDSPVIHKVSLFGLKSGVTYYYQVSGSCTIYQFTMPVYTYSRKSNDYNMLYPFTFGLTGDVGTTNVSELTISALLNLEPDAVLIAGDLSYADGWEFTWDTWGRMSEPLTSQIPLLAITGNHEIQNNEGWVPHEVRYFTPNKGSQSPNPRYWGREVGPVHIISVSSYDAFNTTTLQYKWLKTYLSTKVNRDRTPWVLVMTHVPWYNSNNGHWGEGELIRRSMESLVYEYGVDFFLVGHVHSYERSYEVYNNVNNPCGFVNLNLGDGGNYESTSGTWRYDDDTGLAPSWSAFRENSFGIGELVIHNATHAHFTWNRHACTSTTPGSYGMNFSAETCVSPNDNSAQAMESSDSTWIIKPSQSACPNRWVGSDYQPESDITTGDDDDDNNRGTLVAILLALSVLTAVLSFTLLVVIMKKRQEMSISPSLRTSLL